MRDWEVLSEQCLSREWGQKAQRQSSARLQGESRTLQRALSVFVRLSSRMLLSWSLSLQKELPSTCRRSRRSGCDAGSEHSPLGSWLSVTVEHMLLYKIMCYIFSRYYNEDKWQNVTAVAEFSLLWRYECEVKSPYKQNICLKFYKINLYKIKFSYCLSWNSANALGIFFSQLRKETFSHMLHVHVFVF